MRVNKISVDEQNKEYSVSLDNGNTYHGIKALEGIRTINRGTDFKPLYESDIDWRHIKFLEKKKKKT